MAALTPDWETDRRRFAERVGAGAGLVGSGAPGGTGGLADQRAQIWSPLAGRFADLGRDVFAERTLRGVVDAVLAVAVRSVPGAEFAALTLTRAGEPLHTAGTRNAAGGPDERAAALDDVQSGAVQGPFHDVSRQSGPGALACPDLTGEPAEFAAAAARCGLRSLGAAGVFPAGGGVRGALTAYSASPGTFDDSAADRLLVLACFVAAALGTTDAVTAGELAQRSITEPVRSSVAIERATAVLVERRGLSPQDCYDVLRRATTELVGR